MANQPLRMLFVCSRNRWRSPTAERLVAGWPGYAARSAGVSDRARVKVTEGDLGWADIVFVMEHSHAARLLHKLPHAARSARIECLDIPDDYGFMDPALIESLRDRLSPHIEVPEA